MIKVTVGSTLSKDTMLVDPNRTLRSVLEEAGIDYSVGMTTLDGSTLRAGELDNSFADFGITEKCYLITVVKADSAA